MMVSLDVFFSSSSDDCVVLVEGLTLFIMRIYAKMLWGKAKSCLDVNLVIKNCLLADQNCLENEVLMDKTFRKEEGV